MCGIAGIYSFKNQHNESLVKAMTNAMAHRGPDADGFFHDDTIGLGHRRLSIIDLSQNANQPLYDVTGNYVIIFNGEIYNYKEVKSKLAAQYDFKTASDTEAVLAGYLIWGASVMQHLKGMFAFAIYNKLTRELFISRDRLGVKPVYCYADANHFLFASEIRAILATGLVPKKINKKALSGYLATQSFAVPETIIENVTQLEAGYSIQISASGITKKQYWNIAVPENSFTANDPDTVKAEVYRLLLQSVERRLVSDVPVAAFLSGGIDSSAIVGLMSKVAEPPQTFNIAFTEAEYDESAYAEMVAKKFNTRHHKILLKPAVFLDELPNALAAMDIPSGDGINSYVVSKEIVKNNIKVAVSGVGGDELFAGYPSFKQWYSLQNKKWIWNIPQPIRKFGASFLPGANKKFSRIKELLKANQLDIGTFYPLVRQVFSASQIKNLLQNDAHGDPPFPGDLSGFPILSQFSIAELTGYTQNTLLKDTDQFSMAVSLEVREPFFDHDLIEYVLQIPDSIKYPHFPKQLLVESLGDLLPPEIVHRKKKGFTFPWEHWMRNELKEFSEEHIKSLAKRDFMQHDYTIRLWNDFLQNKNTRWSEIWLLVVLESWLKRNFD